MPAKIQLPNGCSCSEPSVYMGGTKPNCNKNWYVQYYFYDPTFKGTRQYPTLKIVKATINSFKTIQERKEASKIVIRELLHLLRFDGFNPITGICNPPVNTEYEISPHLPFIDALKKASEKIKCASSTKSDIESIIRGTEKASSDLMIKHLPISEIRRKHVKSILEHLERTNPKFSAHRFNKYRAYLLMLFNELVECEATEQHPVLLIKKRTETKKPRRMLTEDERKSINRELHDKHPAFWRFLHIFFHSGARETELLRMQVKDVNLETQSYKCLIKKGKNYRWVERTIKDIVMPLWSELLSNSKPDDFVFSKGLKPGPVQINPNQITRRWRVHVKTKMNIEADFYSLKHLHTTQVMDLLTEETDALKQIAEHNAHTSGAMVIRIYDQNGESRKQRKLKHLRNAFA